jgi:hypothetical protein
MYDVCATCTANCNDVPMRPLQFTSLDTFLLTLLRQITGNTIALTRTVNSAPAVASFQAIASKDGNAGAFYGSVPTNTGTLMELKTGASTAAYTTAFKVVFF